MAEETKQGARIGATEEEVHKTSRTTEESDKPKAKKTPETDSVVALLTAVRDEGGEVFPMSDERILQIIGKERWVTCVNEAHNRDDKLSEADALQVRPKAFDVQPKKKADDK